MFTINHSGFADWQRCKHLYYYREKLKLEPKKIALPLIMGKVGHALVEAKLKGTNQSEAFQSESSIFLDNPTLDKEKVTQVLSSVWAAVEEWNDKPRVINATETEYFISRKLTADILFEGEVDAYGVTPHGNTAVYELKFKQSISNLDQTSERFRPQAILYAAALQDMGIPITHIVREFIYAPLVHLPTLNKNGSMSRAVINCTWAIYKEELRKHGLNPRDYIEMKKKLERKVSEHLVTKITDRMINTFTANVISEALLIKKEKMFPRSWAYDCSRCPFKEPCFLGLADPQGEREILDKFFQPRKSHYAKDKKATSNLKE